MIPLESAEEIINGIASPIREHEVIELNNSLGRILAEDIFSDIDMPPFDKSAMDGYACRIEDLAQPLEVLETIAAGKPPTRTISQGTCSKIMTGAKVPSGANCVVMVEDTSQAGPSHILFTAGKSQKNICLRGEDIRKGDLILTAGSVIAPQTMAMLASVGRIWVKVFKKIEVGFFCTGNELVEPEMVPDGVSIRNSNASQLMAQILTAGAIPVYGGISDDNREAISARIEEMLLKYRIVIITGGVSMGDFDFVPQLLNESGFTVHFQKVGIQPGMPVLFASRENRHVFGLSGNPVSSFLQFKLLTELLISRFYGIKPGIRNGAMIAGEDFTRKKAERKLFIPVVFNEAGQVIQKEFHGSAHIAGLQNSIGFAMIPEGCYEIKKGSVIYVRFL